MSTVVALLGAESTGKTTLAHEMAQALLARGVDAVMVPEALREFCAREGRTPHRHEQRALAEEQTRRIQTAAHAHTVVLADTTALMTAVYSEVVFADTSLYGAAQQAHAQIDMTLLMALDLDWVADGLQRDGPHVREPVDTLVRAALGRMGSPYAVVAGRGPARLQQALSVLEHQLEKEQRQRQAATSPRWRWYCEHCDDGECEQHPLPDGAVRVRPGA